jgi:hypothetical protein
VNDQLSMQRLAWVLRADVLRNYRSWLVATGTLTMVALVISVFGAYDRDVGNEFYFVLFSVALFGLGPLVTSQVFLDLHGRATNTALLLLPASALEKTLSRLLLATVGFVAYLAVLTTVLSWVLEAINALVFGVSRELYTPLEGAWVILPHYLVVQGLFFLGAAWFRKLHFIKTLGSVLLIACGLGAIGAGIAWLFGSVIWDEGIRINDFDTPFDLLTNIAKIAYYFALPAFCWFVAWLRVTETQVSHGI